MASFLEPADSFITPATSFTTPAAPPTSFIEAAPPEPDIRGETFPPVLMSEEPKAADLPVDTTVKPGLLEPVIRRGIVEPFQTMKQGYGALRDMLGMYTGHQPYAEESYREKYGWLGPLNLPLGALQMPYGLAIGGPAEVIFREAGSPASIQFPETAKALATATEIAAPFGAGRFLRWLGRTDVPPAAVSGAFAGPAPRVGAAVTELSGPANRGEAVASGIKFGGGVDATEIYEKRMGLPVAERLIQAAADLTNAGGYHYDPSKRIFLNVTDMIRQRLLPDTDLIRILAEHGYTPASFGAETLANTFREAGTKAGQHLWLLKRFGDEVGVLSPETARILSEAGVPEASAFMEALQPLQAAAEGPVSLFKRAERVTRSLMVTMASTATNNALTQGGRFTLDAVQTSIDAVLQRIGGYPITAHPLDGLEQLLWLGRTGKGDLIRRMDEAGLDVGSRLYATWLGDLQRAGVPYQQLGDLSGLAQARAVVSNTVTAAERGAQVANVLNRSQEFFFRNTTVLAKLDQWLSARGQDFMDIAARGAFHEIPPDLVTRAIEHGLYLTFAGQPKRWLGQHFVEMVNNLPFVPVVGTADIPFPRWIANAARTLIEHQPLSFLRLLGPKERANLAAGNTEAISQAVLGGTLLATAYEFRRSRWGGDKFNEMRLDDGTNLNMGNTNPWVPYLWVADTAARMKDGTMTPLNYKTVLEQVLQLDPSRSTGLATLDYAVRSLYDEAVQFKLGLATQQFTAEYLRRVLVPLQPFRDLQEQIEEGKGYVRYTKGEPLQDTLKSMVPELYKDVPVRYGPTSARPEERPEPTMRHAIGAPALTVKNPVERELDRLGIVRQQYAPGSGDPEMDQLVYKRMGPLTEKLVPILEGAEFQSWPLAYRRDWLRTAMSAAHASAVQAAMPDNPPLTAWLALGHASLLRRRSIDEAAGGLIFDPDNPAALETRLRKMADEQATRRRESDKTNPPSTPALNRIFDIPLGP